ncbi:MAG: hypothetical protein ACJ8OJ_11355, partial [Povalibacter sp.]
MKLLRYGPVGRERPALLDSSGTLRDLSEVVRDIGGEALAPDSLRRIASIDHSNLPAVAGGVRIGPCVG